MPSAVADMLLDLDIHGGERVLDSGTGTGWTAALLAARGCTVTTVEVDEHLADQARKNLTRAGYPNVTVITGDGTHGHPTGAAYDRIHVTAGVRHIPATWLEQAAPEAIFLLPWGTDCGPHDAALRLVVESSTRASGPFTMALWFMKLRAQRAAPPTIDLPEGWPGVASAGGTVASVAAAGFADGRRPNVLQAGPRSLWSEVEAARRWWDRAGRPEVFDFGLTVTTGGRGPPGPWYASPERENPGI
ncbi:protein-L-isoaspartate O-methyltransferase family protein [Embleya sp. MST-111070]|uniref:protein-L-isoaspartate O-methyltransferase family protein n=1 Tax=Embleya sp. MST-111070 TaxID=3398231 RepID=UPI003F739B12